MARVSFWGWSMLTKTEGLDYWLTISVVTKQIMGWIKEFPVATLTCAQ